MAVVLSFSLLRRRIVILILPATMTVYSARLHVSCSDYNEVFIVRTGTVYVKAVWFGGLGHLF